MGAYIFKELGLFLRAYVRNTRVLHGKTDMDWNLLRDQIARFQKLREKTGTDKSSSYEVKIVSSVFDDGIELALGTYEIGSLPRWTKIQGKDDNDTLEQFTKFVDKCEEIVG